MAPVLRVVPPQFKGFRFIVDEQHIFPEGTLFRGMPWRPGCTRLTREGSALRGLQFLQGTPMHIDVQAVDHPRLGIVEIPGRVGPPGALGLDDQRAKQAMRIGTVLIAIGIAQVMEQERALVIALPNVLPGLLVIHQGIEAAHGRAVAVNVGAGTDQVHADAAAANQVGEFDDNLVADPGPEHQRLNLGVRLKIAFNLNRVAVMMGFVTAAAGLGIAVMTASLLMQDVAQHGGVMFQRFPITRQGIHQTIGVVVAMGIEDNRNRKGHHLIGPGAAGFVVVNVRTFRDRVCHLQGSPCLQLAISGSELS